MHMSYSSQVNKMKLDVTIFQDEDGMYIAECSSIPGCVSQGKTEEEAILNIKQAAKECLEVRAEKGLPPIVESHHVEINV